MKYKQPLWRRSNQALLFYLLISTHFINCLTHFVLISAPGSGKGTFSQYMVTNHGYIQICPGDLLRKEIALGTDFGKKIQPIVDNGDYVDEEIICNIIKQYVCTAINQKKGFILDGFPRSKKSFNFLDSLLREKNLTDNVYFLQFIASDTVCAHRMANRVICMQCNYVFNTISNQSRCKNICHQCGSELSLRKADTLDIAYKRLNYFHDYIESIMEIAKQKYKTIIINSDCSLDNLEKEYEKLLV